MALIDYLNRVHFAENIIEEAVWAELDRRRDRSFLLLATRNRLDSELGDRLRAGLPKQVRTVACHVSGGVPTEAEAQRVAGACRASECDALLAFGRGYVVNMAKAARLLIGHDAPLERYAESVGGTLQIARSLPDLIAIPELQGFVAGFNGLFSILQNDGSMIDIASRNLVPTVTIGDPTIAMHEPAAIQAGAIVEAITLCIEALLSPNYNPPANGIALDGLNRGLRTLTSVSDTADLDARREMMAACMNAAMVQQKGLGLAHAITGSLCATTGMTLDKGAIKRLLLPKILGYYNQNRVIAHSALMGALGLTNPADVEKSISRALRGLPLAGSLSELGVSADHLAGCSERASHHRALSNVPHRPLAADILAILQSIL